MRTKEKKPKKGFLDGYKTYDTKFGHGNVSEWRAAWNEKMSHNEATSTLDKDNPLEVMGFDSMPSKSDLDKRYRELVMKHHPDRGGDPKEFKRIHAAWSILTEQI
jgi:DnaJ-domain-containing protein 1